MKRFTDNNRDGHGGSGGGGGGRDDNHGRRVDAGRPSTPRGVCAVRRRRRRRFQASRRIRLRLFCSKIRRTKQCEFSNGKQTSCGRKQRDVCARNWPVFNRLSRVEFPGREKYDLASGKTSAKIREFVNVLINPFFSRILYQIRVRHFVDIFSRIGVSIHHSEK